MGLKSKESSSNVLFAQRSKEGKASPAEETTVKPLIVKVIGEETLQFEKQSFLCEVRCPLGDKGQVDTEDRQWVVKEGRYSGAVLRAESPRGTLTTRKIWDHLVRIKGSEFVCLVVEAESKAGEKTTAVKTWYCADLPGPLRMESEGKSVNLVDFGASWSKRPAFPNPRK